MYLVAFVLIAALVAGALVAVARRLGPRATWRLAVVLAMVLVGAMVRVDGDVSETSPVSLVLAAVLPAAGAASVAHAGRRTGWRGTWAVAAAVTIVLPMPALLLGCLVATWLPVRECFF